LRFFRFGIVALLCIFFLGKILGGEESEKNVSPNEVVSLSYVDILNNRLKQGVDKKEFILLIDSILGSEYIDPVVVDLLNSKIEESFGREWPIDTNPYPAHNLYKSWNTLLPHPYKNDICKTDSEAIYQLTDQFMNCGYGHPVEGVVTSRFGWRDSKHHNGIDINLVLGDTVVNAFRGVVRLAKWTGGYGRTIIVRHNNGLETIYAHLYKFLVKAGDIVDPGQPIARGGNSGASRGSHLHFETRFKGKPLNPESLIDFKNFQLHSDSLVIRKTPSGYVSFQPGTLFYEIKGGDYLYKIANQYGISVNQICKWNSIKRNTVLIAGKSLKVSN
jgi:murein DD-endopeptidase MepM/ murein hydrolase activator NlpD